MLKEIKVAPLSAKDILGESIFAYSDGYLMPLSAIIRDVFTRYRKDFEEGVLFIIPRYGVLHTSGRAFEFTPEEGYRKVKGLANVVSGTWGG